MDSLRAAAAGESAAANALFSRASHLPAALKEMSKEDIDRLTAIITAAQQQHAEAQLVAEELRAVVINRKKHAVVLKRRLKDEAAQLQNRISAAAGTLERSREMRGDLVRQYVLWRRRREFDEDAVAPTFEEELALGPRQKDIGIQCDVQAETLPMQVLKMVRLVEEEDTLRRHVKGIRSIVGDMMNINRYMEIELTCPVCERLFVNCVVAWPCGHSYCAQCYESLLISPGLYRCRLCSLYSTEGCTPNFTVNEVVGRWLFKMSGFSDVNTSVDSVSAQLAAFSKSEVQRVLKALAAVAQDL